MAAVPRRRRLLFRTAGFGTLFVAAAAVAVWIATRPEPTYRPGEAVEGLTADLARDLPPLQRNLHQFLAREISRDHGVMLLLGSMRAEERLASFLLNLSERYRARGYSSTEFVLRMTREEIGSYLGLKLETVSRVFSRFQDDGMVSVQQKHIRIIDIPRLKQVVGHPSC